jgi:hypothetical protein
MPCREIISESYVSLNSVYNVADNSLCHYFYFNISGLEAEESILQAQLHLYRMKTPPHEIHPTVFASPSLIVSTPYYF